MTSTRLRTVAVLLVLTGGACGSGDNSDDSAAKKPAASPAAGSDAAVVTVKTFQFQPDPIEVEAGTRITFQNLDKINHSVTAGTRDAPKPETFDGVMDGAGNTFELTLDKPGTYDYFCKFHPGEGMTAKIVVR